MTEIRVVPAEPRHVLAVAARMRPEDRDEVWATAHMNPEQALTYSIAHSVEAWAGLADGDPVCLFGVGTTDLLSRVGLPWLLTATGLISYQRAFLRRNRPMIVRWSQMFPVLVGWVDQRNTRSQAWLKWLGFDLGPAEPFGIEGLPFHKFVMRCRER